MSQSMKRRVEAIEKQAGHSEQRLFGIIEHSDGTITKLSNGEPADPSEVLPGDQVMHVCSPPWDSTLLRRLTDDEMEAKYPGRRERLARWNGVLKGRPNTWEASPEDLLL